MSLIDFDHCYSKHWSEDYLTKTSRGLPLKWLLKLDDDECIRRSQYDRSDTDSAIDSDDELDVDREGNSPNIIGSTSWHCAEQKARMQMNECERHVASTIKNGNNTASDERECYWEDNINKSHWSVVETKLFNRAIHILQDEKLARLAYKGSSNELVLRRLSVDRSASKLRSALANTGWQVKLTQWLHALLIENLPSSLLSYYLDVMQTLRSKVPTLIERMIMPSRDTGSASAERLGILLKRPWDPAVTAVVSNMKQKLSNSVLFIVVQCNATQSSLLVTSRRLRFWNSLLSQIGKVVQVTAPADDETIDDKTSQNVQEFTERMTRNVSSRIHELHSRHANRKVILIGWHTTSLINCHVSLKEEVSGIVCLGFPLDTMFGQRGSIDDVLCDVSAPTLFIIGDKSSLCNIDDMEDVREKMFSDALTSLLVVCGADDWLRVSEKNKRRCVATQSMVDRQILEGICDFLHTIFLPPRQREQTMKSASLTMEGSILKKRPHSMSDLQNYNQKRQRSSSTSLLRHSSTSAQINQILSNQKQTFNEEADAKLQGLSFNLQTGSVSGLTSVPCSISEGRQRSSSGNTHKSEPAPACHASTDATTRSITIDLTKDPNAQLSSALSKRKSQLLQPTVSQTEAAVAAILGSELTKKVDAHVVSNKTKVNNPASISSSTQSSQTAVMSPSSHLRRYASGNSIQGSSIKSTDPNQSFSVTLGCGIGNLSTKSSFEMNRHQQSFKPRGGLSRLSGNDKSFISSRSRREDRETQQATEILEQLTSSLDAGKDTGSSPASPEHFPSGTPQIESNIIHNYNAPASRSKQIISTESKTKMARSRSKVEQPRTSTNTKPSVVRYVLTSSGLSGVLASRGGARRIALVPEHVTPSQSGHAAKPTHLVLAPGSRKQSTSTSSGVLRSNSAKAVGTVASDNRNVAKVRSSTPFMDFVLGSALTRSVTNPHTDAQTPRATQHVRKHVSSGNSLAVKGSDGKNVVNLREKARTCFTNAQHKTNPTYKQQQRAVLSGKSIGGGRGAMLSITRPRSLSAGTPQSRKLHPVNRTVSDATSEEIKRPVVRFPALVLTKLSNDSIDNVDGKP